MTGLPLFSIGLVLHPCLEADMCRRDENAKTEVQRPYTTHHGGVCVCVCVCAGGWCGSECRAPSSGTRPTPARARRRSRRRSRRRRRPRRRATGASRRTHVSQPSRRYTQPAPLPAAVSCCPCRDAPPKYKRCCSGDRRVSLHSLDSPLIADSRVGEPPY